MSSYEIAMRYSQAEIDQDLTVMAELGHPDIVIRYPQSGETIHGLENYIHMLENYPGGLADMTVTATHGARDTVRVGNSPFGMPVITVSGAGNTFFAEGIVEYPDAGKYNFACILELQDGLIVKETAYFAAPFEAPSWRAPYVD